MLTPGLTRFSSLHAVLGKAALVVALIVPQASTAQAGWARQQQAAGAMSRGDHKEAARLLEEEVAESIRTRGERDPETLGQLFELASAYASLGRLVQSVELDERVLKLRLEVLERNHPDTLQSMGSVARKFVAMGRHSEAVTLGEKALMLSRERFGARAPATLDAMGTLAGIYGAVGRLADALPLEEEGLKLRTEVLIDAHPSTIIAMGNLASTYRNLGYAEQALALEERVLAQFVKNRGERSPAALIALNNLAGTYVSLGRVREALPLQEKVLKLRTEAHGDRAPDTLTAMINLAATYRDLDRHVEALDLSEKAMKLSVEVLGNRHAGTQNAIAHMASTYLAAGRPADALALAEQVLKWRTEVLGERHPQTLESTVDLAASYAGAGRLEDAATLSSRYVAGAELQRAQPGLSSEDRQAIFKTYARNYRFFSSVHGVLGRREEGFHLSELSKARTLLESMVMQRANRSGALPEREQAHLEDLERQIGALSQSTAQTSDPESRQALLVRRNDFVRQAQALRDRLKREYPKFAQLSDVSLLGAGDLRGLVAPEAIAVSYLVIGDGSKSHVTAWIADSGGHLEFRSLGEIHHLSDVVEAVRRSSGHRDGLKGMQAADSLRVWRLPLRRGYRLLDSQSAAPEGALPVTDAGELSHFLAGKLLAPLSQILGGKREWIISPDGPLAQLPFEVLPWGEKGEPAVSTADIQYTQSLSVFALGKAKRKQYQSLKGRRVLFAIGNPQYQPREASPEAGRNLSRNRLVRNAQQLRELDAMWPNLPGTEREVLAVAGLFGSGASVFLGPQATEHRLQAINAEGDLAKYRYLLFSTHGYLSQTEPALSSLVLGLVNRAQGTDGYVTAAEWPGYDLRSDLAVLSACDTGVGRVISGEGVMGLPFALFVAGNVNTILSLWPVEDEATAEFMKALFTKLKAGSTPARALNETKRQFLLGPAKGRFASPSLWAPFILIGPG